MKKEYIVPNIEIERFVSNEYCSACGPTGQKTYKFICDAPGGVVYTDDGTKWGSYTPCGDTHEVTVSNEEELPFYDGFVDRNGNGIEDEGENAVIWLHEDKFWGIPFTNRHASATYQSIEDIENLKS